MIKTLIVPLDGSPNTERAASIAGSIAREVAAEVVLVTVSPLRDRSYRYLESVKHSAGLDGRIQVVDSTDVPGALALVVGSEKEPVVCMATHGRGRVGRAFLGSVAESLLREVSAPFLLIGPRCAPEWSTRAKRAVVCLDESRTAEAILGPAVEWAGALGLELWMTEVFHPLDLESAREPFRYLDTVVEHLHLQALNVQKRAEFGSYVPGRILELAEALPASMIAMSTHGQGGLHRLAVGSVTMEVTHRAPCPVLTVRPVELCDDTAEAQNGLRAAGMNS